VLQRIADFIQHDSHTATFGSVPITNLTSHRLISSDLIASKLSGREATQSAVAATDENRLLFDGGSVTRVVMGLAVGFQVGYTQPSTAF